MRSEIWCFQLQKKLNTTQLLLLNISASTTLLQYQDEYWKMRANPLLYSFQACSSLPQASALLLHLQRNRAALHAQV